MTLLLLVAGLALLGAGAEALVAGARRLALRAGMSPIVIGLTIVAFGTSAPELVVSVRAALGGSASIAIGNVVGSNVFNVLVILGLGALVTPLTIAQQLVRFDVPLLIGVSAVTWWLVRDGVFGPWEGAVFVAGIVLYTAAAVRTSRREAATVREEYQASFGEPRPGRDGIAPLVVLIVGGLAALTIGAGWLIRGATHLARSSGVSELVIGLTIVAGGTSLPEAATSVVAAFRGERDIAVGNVVGSNLFNLLSVLGLSAVLAPAGIPVPQAAIHFDIPVMVLVAALCLPIFFTGFVISRLEGLLFLFGYACYLAYLLLAATQHPALPLVRGTMLIVVPLSVLVIAAHAGMAALRRSRANAGPAPP